MKKRKKPFKRGGGIREKGKKGLERGKGNAEI